MTQKTKTAFIFPGQGSQYIGMGKDISQLYPAAGSIFQKADKVLNIDLSTLCFEGPEEILRQTVNTQPAILTCSMALLEALRERMEIRPDYVAGHSLGEYSALCCSGAISFEDAVLTVQKRGSYMQDAVPLGTGTMAAIIGISEEKVREYCDKASRKDHIVVLANINCPKQYVISGHTDAVEEVIKLSKGDGAITVPLAVSAPFHSPLMEKAAAELTEWLDQIRFKDLNIPLINNAEAEMLKTGNEARTSLIRQMQASVKWENAMRKLISNGVSTFIEIGPGKVLSGLLKRIDRSVTALNISDAASLEQTVTYLGEDKNGS